MVAKYTAYGCCLGQWYCEYSIKYENPASVLYPYSEETFVDIFHNVKVVSIAYLQETSRPGHPLLTCDVVHLCPEHFALVMTSYFDVVYIEDIPKHEEYLKGRTFL